MFERDLSWPLWGVQSLLVITVLFRIKLTQYGRFVREVHENARLSLEKEHECYRFDVSCAPERNEVFLYEIYADATAFDLHKNMSHYLEFSAVTKPWIEEKNVRRFYMRKDNKDG
ncbi:MAG: antibiotic biosynthesis monooxygenase [Roseovarius sp.]|uniref:putative quinol monooxygenase n=1 Tax=Roseovarius sp. TaxID=1486281 RepID=UPI0032EF4481